MNDPLYAKDLLRLAARASGAGHLDRVDARGSAHNPACGDKIAVELELDAKGQIVVLAHDTKACVLAQASASILGAQLGGAAASDVRRLRAQISEMLSGGADPEPPFEDYTVLKGATAYRSRHICVLLPIDAVLDALNAK